MAEVCIAVCDGLKGLPDAITTVWELAQVQTCVIHLILNTFRYAARQDWDKRARDLKPIYTAVNAEQAEVRMDEFADKWVGKYPAAVKLWRSAWVRVHLLPGLRRGDLQDHLHDERERESERPLPARRAGAGPLPERRRALKCLYLVTRSLDPTGRRRARRVIRWKAALNAFAITFEGRTIPSSN